MSVSPGYARNSLTCVHIRGEREPYRAVSRRELTPARSPSSTSARPTRSSASSSIGGMMLSDRRSAIETVVLPRCGLAQPSEDLALSSCPISGNSASFRDVSAGPRRSGDEIARERTSARCALRPEAICAIGLGGR